MRLTGAEYWPTVMPIMVDEALVRLWISEVQEKIKAKRLEVDRLQGEIAADSAREAALRAVLTAGSPPSDTETTPEVSRSFEAQAPSGEAFHPVEAGALEVLRERGKPTHVSEIRAELLRRKVPIPGKGTDANVIVYLSKNLRVCRVGRGLYALKEWGVPQVPRRHRRSTPVTKARHRDAPRKSS